MTQSSPTPVTQADEEQFLTIPLAHRVAMGGNGRKAVLNALARHRTSSTASSVSDDVRERLQIIAVYAAGYPGSEQCRHIEKIARDAIASLANTPAASSVGADERALKWIRHNLHLAEQMMKTSADQGNGYANFAAHDAHHALTAALAALAPLSHPASAISDATRRMEETLGAKFVPASATDKGEASRG